MSGCATLNELPLVAMTGSDAKFVGEEVQRNLETIKKRRKTATSFNL